MGPLKHSYNKYQVDNHILCRGLAAELSGFQGQENIFHSTRKTCARLTHSERRDL